MFLPLIAASLLLLSALFRQDRTLKQFIAGNRPEDRR